MRSVVFRTPGKLDLRAITIMGLNAKPSTTNPIGFFGTGLKYALAVLARNNLATTIWVGDQKWTVDKVKTNFRGKEVETLWLMRHRKVLAPKGIQLPFTTELGKTWELWQAFRELYANTLDENGETFICDLTSEGTLRVQGVSVAPKICTHIIVEGEAFVQEYLEREKTFLPDALRQQESSSPVQQFDRPAKHIYWRGMRVHDLKEPSLYTYNILAPIDLTEDRTAKYEFQIKQQIEEYIRNHAPKDVVKQTILAPYGKFENRLGYDYHYTAPSKAFIDTVKSAPQADLTAGARRHAASYMPPEPVKVLTKDELYEKAYIAIENGDYTSLEEAVNADREFFKDLLSKGKEAWDDEQPAAEEVDPEACVDCGSKGECADGCPSRLAESKPDLEDEIPF